MVDTLQGDSRRMSEWGFVGVCVRYCYRFVDGTPKK